MKIRTLTFLASLCVGSFLQLGCSPLGIFATMISNGSDEAPKPSAPPPLERQKVHCGPEWTREDSDNEIYDTIPIQRNYRKYIYTGCQGEILEERWKTVKDPKNSYILRAKTLEYGNRPIYISSYNRTTCDYGHYKDRDEFDPEMTIKMHTSSVRHRMEIDRKNENIVFYRFSECVAYDASDRCIEFRSLEKGELYLTVDYKEEYNSDPVYVEDCKDSSD